MITPDLDVLKIKEETDEYIVTIQIQKENLRPMLLMSIIYLAWI